MFIQVESGCPQSGPLVGELVFCPHRMQEAESSFLQDGRGRGRPKQACPLAGCLRLLPMCFGLGQGEPVRGLAPSLQGKGLAGRAWRNPRLTVSHSCFCVRLPYMYAPLYHPSVRGLWVFEFPHALRPMANFYWPHHLIIRRPLKDFSCIFYPQSTWDQTSGIIFESFPP